MMSVARVRGPAAQVQRDPPPARDTALRLLAGLLLSTVLVGCADSPEPAPPAAASPSAPASSSSSSGPSAPAASPTASGTAAPPVAAGREAVPLQVGLAQADPRLLVVQFVAPDGCPRQQVRYTVTETAQQVSVQLTSAAVGQGACTGELTPGNVEIPLAQPVGDRELVDATTGVQVQVAIGTPPGPPVPAVPAEPG